MTPLKTMPFTGDCPYCEPQQSLQVPIDNRFSFGPRGGAGRMLRCVNCRAEFIWFPGLTHGPVNVIIDNEAFPRDKDGGCRRRD